MKSITRHAVANQQVSPLTIHGQLLLQQQDVQQQLLLIDPRSTATSTVVSGRGPGASGQLRSVIQPEARGCGWALLTQQKRCVCVISWYQWLVNDILCLSCHLCERMTNMKDVDFMTGQRTWCGG